MKSTHSCNVLDKGHVVLVRYMPSDITVDESVAQSARASTYRPHEERLSFIKRIWPSSLRKGQILFDKRRGLFGEKKDRKLVRSLIRDGHTSTLEHAVFTFHVKAPIVVARQWMRHRTWSYNEASGRYQEYPNEYYVPSSWRKQASSNRQGSSNALLSPIYSRCLSFLFLLTLLWSNACYQLALYLGVSREQARIFLPALSIYTEFYATVNLNNLLKFLQQRDSEHAQYEIRVYAEAISSMLREVCPWVMEEYDKKKLG